MTSKERVMAALTFQKPDRVPLFDSFWAGFVRRWREEKGLGADASVSDYYGVDIAICVADETPWPSRKATMKDDARETLTRDGYGRMVRTVKGAFFSEYAGHPIRRTADLDWNPFDPVEDDSRYGGFLRVVAENLPKRCCFCKVGGPYLRTTFIRGEEAFLMDIAGDPEFAKALADRMADFLTGIGLESLRRSGLYDTGIWIYDDIAYNHNPMVSPASFERVFLPGYRRMAGAFKRAGARRVIMHSDGNIGPLLDMLIDAGIDGINPVEPKGAMDLVEIKRKYGDRLSLIGGMCNAHVLPNGTRAEIVRKTREILKAGRDGGVVIGTHSIGDDIPVAHYDWFHETVMREG